MLPVAVEQTPQDFWHSSPFSSHFPCFTKKLHFHAGDVSSQSDPNSSKRLKELIYLLPQDLITQLINLL